MSAKLCMQENPWIAPLHPTKPAHDDLKLDNKH